MSRKILTTTTAPPPLVDDRHNVIQMPDRPGKDDRLDMPDRGPTSLELKLAKVMHNLHNETQWDDLAEDDIVRWIWIKTARFAIREMRALPYDITQKIRGKPFYDAKSIWETIIDASSPP